MRIIQMYAITASSLRLGDLEVEMGWVDHVII